MAVDSRRFVVQGVKQAAPFGAAAVATYFLVGFLLGVALVLSSNPESIVRTLSNYNFLLVLPPVVLAFFGRNFVRARRYQLRIEDPVDGAKAGALIAGGYFVVSMALLLLAMAVFPIRFDVTELFIRTVVYPVVFGAIGGFLEV